MLTYATNLHTSTKLFLLTSSKPLLNSQRFASENPERRRRGGFSRGRRPHYSAANDCAHIARRADESATQQPTIARILRVAQTNPLLNSQRFASENPERRRRGGFSRGRRPPLVSGQRLRAYGASRRRICYSTANDRAHNVYEI